MFPFNYNIWSEAIIHDSFLITYAVWFGMENELNCVFQYYLLLHTASLKWKAACCNKLLLILLFLFHIPEIISETYVSFLRQKKTFFNCKVPTIQISSKPIQWFKRENVTLRITISYILVGIVGINSCRFHFKFRQYIQSFLEEILIITFTISCLPC